MTRTTVTSMRMLALALPLACGGCDDVGSVGQPSTAVAVDRQASSPARSAIDTDWPEHRGNAGLTGIASGTVPDAPAMLWTFESGGAIVSSPVVSDGLVYFGSDDGNVYAVDVETGESRWTFSTEYIIEAPPMVHGGTVYIGSHDFFMYALDAKSGEMRWKFETYEKIVGAAVVVKGPSGEDLIVFGSHDAFLYALDATTGEQRWTFETNDRINATPAVIDNRIIFGGCDTILYVLDGATGRSLSQIELGGECHIAASVGLDDNTAFFGHHANEFVSIDLGSEATRWVYPQRFGFYSSPAITKDRVVFGGRDKRLHCVDRGTGEPVWTFAARRKIDAAPVICDGRVIVGSGDGRLYMVRLADGEEVWSYDIGKPVFSSAAIASGRIFVGANDGFLYAFGAPSSSPEQGQQ